MILDNACMNIMRCKGVNAETIYVVSGLPRSGTSMMMRMGAAGGLDPLIDGARATDEANPHGYFEFEPAKSPSSYVTWISDASGRLLKVVSRFVRALPATHYYKVVFMRRALDKILRSQVEMAQNHGGVTWSLQDSDRLRSSYQTHLDESIAWLRNRPNVGLLQVWYEDAVVDPIGVAREVAAFYDCGIDPAAMAAAVDTKLNRQGAVSQQPIKGVVFDLDGVIIDSLPAMEEAYYSACARVLDFSPPSFSEYKKHLGRSFPEIMRILGLPSDPLHKVFKEESLARIDTVLVFPGIRQVLDDLRAKKVPMTVATGKDTKRAEQILKHLNLDHYFDAVFGSDAVENPKPAPDLLRKSLSAIGVSPQDALFVGDAPSDLEAGLAADLRTVAVLWGRPDREALALVPHLIDLRRPEELLTLIVSSHV